MNCYFRKKLQFHKNSIVFLFECASASMSSYMCVDVLFSLSLPLHVCVCVHEFVYVCVRLYACFTSWNKRKQTHVFPNE